MAKRKALSKKTRFDVFKRDGFACQYCGKSPPVVCLEIDHIIPVASGGGNEETNLLTSCEDCNSGKSDRPLTTIPKALDESLASQVERREQLEAYNAFLMKARKRDKEMVEQLGVYWCDHGRPESEHGKWIPSNERLQSLRTFLKRLPACEIYDAMDIAHARVRSYGSSDTKVWKYFCGVCWSKIKQAEGETK